MQLKLLTAVLIASASCFVGCGDGRPTRMPVAGRVVIDGQPVRFGMIKLTNADTRAASSRLDEEGRFQMTCFEKHDGVIPGAHRVEVAATEGIDERTVRWHAPKKYASANTSGIEVTIDEPTEDLLIELTWSGGKGPFVERQ
jgi:hypothetical protein